MMLWKKGVGEGREDCSRIMLLDRRRRVDQKPEVSRWKMESSIGRRTELARRNGRAG